MEDLNTLSATVKVKLTKRDEHGNIIGVEEHERNLNNEEAKLLWHLQQQD